MKNVDYTQLAGKTLFVAAVDGEAEHVGADVPLLITGIGTVPAAMKLTEVLAKAEATGGLPERVVNFGTAGALRDGLAGVFEITQVRKHDFHLEDHSGIQQYLLPEVIEVEPSGKLPLGTLATGDQFIGDSETRARLAVDSSLCDMEGYAIAAVCQHFNVAVTLLKQVSDSANEEAEEAWADAVPEGARQLRSALEFAGFLG